MRSYILNRLPRARVAAIMGGTMLVGSLISSSNSADAAQSAAQAQTGASQAEITERQRQFDTMRGLLQPWIDTGNQARDAAGNLIGLNGAGPQQTSIDALKTGPQFTSLKNTGENAILSNASATGGLRGGNTNAALATYDQSILSGLIDQQYSRLNGISGAGQNAAAGVGSAAINVGNQNAGSISEAGAAQAGGILGQAKAANGFINSAVNAAGVFTGYGSGGIRPVALPAGAPMVGGFDGGPMFA